MLLHRPNAGRPNLDHDPAEGEGDSGLRCPKCGWRPRRHDRWSCTCGHVWNTFETRGVCPGCGLTWSETQCRRCRQWSRHDDWYVRDAGGG